MARSHMIMMSSFIQCNSIKTAQRLTVVVAQNRFEFPDKSASETDNERQ